MSRSRSTPRTSERPNLPPACLPGLRALLQKAPDAHTTEPALGWTHRLLCAQLGTQPLSPLERSRLEPLLHRDPAEVYALLQPLQPSGDTLQDPIGQENHSPEAHAHLQRRLQVAARLARRQVGRYYTAPRWARLLVRLTLQPWLERGDPEQLQTLQVLDPALGTGVFLQETALCLAERLQILRGGTQREWLERVASTCLWGLDIDPVAVKLATWGLIWRARAPWLEPLLAERLRVANTLVGTEPSQLPWPDVAALSSEQQQLLCHAWTLEALEGLTPVHPESQPEALRTFEGHRHGVKGLQHHRQATQAWRWLEQTGQLEGVRERAQAEKCISLTWLGRGGQFDAVVGNPPYLSEARGGAGLVLQLKRSPRIAAEYQPRGDLFYPFLSIGSRLLTPGGRLGLLVPPYWRSRSSAATLRDVLATRVQEVVRVEFGNQRLFSEAPGHHSELVVWQAGAAPPLSVFVWGPEQDEQRLMQALTDAGARPSGQEGPKNPCKRVSPLSREEEVPLRCLGRIPSAWVTQGVVMPQAVLNRVGLARLPVGVAQVGDGIFWLRDEEVAGLGLNSAEKALLGPYLPVAAVSAYHVGPSSGSLIYLDGHARQALEQHPAQFPALVAHLSRFAPAITSAAGPFGLHRPRAREVFETPGRLLVVRKAREVRAARAWQPLYVDQGYNIVIPEREEQGALLMALLHARCVGAWLGQRKQLGGLLQLDKEVLCSLPIPWLASAPVWMEDELAQQLQHEGPLALVSRVEQTLPTDSRWAQAAVSVLVRAQEADAHRLHAADGREQNPRRARPGRGGRFIATYSQPGASQQAQQQALDLLVASLYHHAQVQGFADARSGDGV